MSYCLQCPRSVQLFFQLSKNSGSEPPLPSHWSSQSNLMRIKECTKYMCSTHRNDIPEQLAHYSCLHLAPVLVYVHSTHILGVLFRFPIVACHTRRRGKTLSEKGSRMDSTGNKRKKKTKIQTRTLSRVHSVATQPPSEEILLGIV